MVTMTLTDTSARRARPLAARPVCASAAARRATSMSVVPVPNAHTTNLWLGGAQEFGFGSTYATKRITTGRLEGVT